MQATNRQAPAFLRRLGTAALGALLLGAMPVASGDDRVALDEEVQDLRAEVLELNRDLFRLEEELLFPASTQLSVFLSMDVGEFFELDAVSLKLNGDELTHYLYTEREVRALLAGGVHRIHLGNLRAGEHELVAVFTGTGPHGRDYRRGATLRFEKGLGAKFVELAISDRERRLQPEFIVREWE